MTEDFIKSVQKDLVMVYGEDGAKKIINANIELAEEDPLFVLLKRYLYTNEWFLKNKDKIKDNDDDKYAIYCYLKSEVPSRSVINGRRLSYYDDLYFNLQIRGYCFSISDRFKWGKKREKFKIVHQGDIIYPPQGRDFVYDSYLFYSIQAEYIRETLKTSQGNAKRLIISKYGRLN